MKVLKIKFTLSTGFVGAEHEETVELEFKDDMTEEEIEEILEKHWEDWIWNYIDGGWKILKEEVSSKKIL